MRMTGCTVFMQDGAPCHTSCSSMEWLEENNVKVLDWVGQSCDLNPIENCWTRLIANMPACSNLDKLIKMYVVKSIKTLLILRRTRFAVVACSLTSP